MLSSILFTHNLEILYGSLTLFTSILHNVFLLYHVDMFVTVYRIDKVSFWFGEAVFLAWNSLNDPLFGWISDSKFLHESNNEKSFSNSDIVWSRLSSLQKFGPLFSVSFTLFWINWHWPGAQFAACLCFYDGCLTMIDLHHNALLADLSISAEKRTKLNSYCSIFSAIGSVSVFMSYLFWNKSDTRVFRNFCFVLAIIAFFGYVVVLNAMKSSYYKQAKDSSSLKQ